jgi:hypothetical protein
MKQTRDDLMASGKRAVCKNQCPSVAVAADHTGEDNYHNCVAGKPGHLGLHGCGCDIRWDDAGNIVDLRESTAGGPEPEPWSRATG